MDGKLGSFASAQQFEIAYGYRFGFGHTEQVDPTGKNVFHPGFLQFCFGFLDPLLVGKGLLHRLLVVAHFLPRFTMAMLKARRVSTAWETYPFNRIFDWTVRVMEKRVWVKRI